MAIDSQIKKWDEDSINALYRAWQRSRDGINYGHYRPIIEVAKQIAQGTDRQVDVMEQRMDLIRAAAREQVLGQKLPDQLAVGEFAEVAPATRPRSSALQRKIESTGSSILEAVAGFFDSLSPKQWVPVAVTAALVVAVVPFVFDSGTDSGLYQNLSAQTDILSSNGATVVSELDRLGEYQHGFSSSDSQYARAFSAGVIFTNLIGLANQPEAAQQAKSISDLERLTGQSLNLHVAQSDNPSQSLASLGDQLQSYYSKDGYWSVFVFGQWVETGYLLSRLALSENDNSQSVTALTALLNDSDQISELLTQSDLYAERLTDDLDKLNGAVGDGLIDQQELAQVSNLLLKLRTVEARQ